LAASLIAPRTYEAEADDDSGHNGSRQKGHINLSQGQSDPKTRFIDLSRKSQIPIFKPLGACWKKQGTKISSK